MNQIKTGEIIASLRKAKQLTQAQLGEKLNISFQAVSKWERGESLPDVTMLLALSEALETTTDNILRGGEAALKFKGRKSAKDIKDGLDCFIKFGMLVGRDNFVYLAALDGMSEKMNTDIENMLDDELLKECLFAEALIQDIIAGYYFDISEIRGAFIHDKWYNVVENYAVKHGLK